MACIGDELFRLCASAPLVQMVGMTFIFLALVGATIWAGVR